MLIILGIILVSVQSGDTLDWYNKKEYYKRIMSSWWNSIQSTIHTPVTFPCSPNIHKQAQNSTSINITLEYKTYMKWFLVQWTTVLGFGQLLVHHVHGLHRFVGMSWVNKMINPFPYFIRICTHNFVHGSPSTQ